MNKTKRGLQLAAAIISIVLAALLTIGAIYVLAALEELTDAADTNGLGLSVMKVTYILILCACIANIIVSSLICRKPNDNMFLGLSITALVMNAILALLYIIAGTAYAILPLVVVGLFIAELCMPNKTANETHQPNSIESQDEIPANPVGENTNLNNQND